jgi:hypothetical protein
MAKIDPGYVPSMQQAGLPHRRFSRRRWAWWFGAPWLVLGAAAWWLKSDRLLDLALVFWGLACLAHVSDGMRTGVVLGKWGEEYDREKDPSSFWSGVALYTLFGVGLLLSVLVRLIGT